MDKKQIDWILTNLSKLVRNTDCTVVLLADLVSKRILHDEDVQTIQAPGATKYKQSYTLYRILMTRPASFDDLVEVFSAARQKSVSQIFLQFGCKESLTEGGSIFVEDKKYLGMKSRTKLYHGKMGYRSAVAVRKTKLSDENPANISWETNILEKLPCHSNIVQFYHAEIRLDNFLLAFEKCTLSLESLVKGSHTEVELHTESIDILRQAASGLAFLHKNKILHLNLTPSKILVSFRSGYYGLVKISDFRKSRRLDDKIPMETEFISYNINLRHLPWTPPEILNSLDAYGEVNPASLDFGMYTDIFSLGPIFEFTLGGGHRKFNELLDWLHRVTIRDETIQSSNLIGFNGKEALDLVTRMISIDPMNRPNCNEVIHHPYFINSPYK